MSTTPALAKYVTEEATVYRSGALRRFRWRLVALENGEKIAQSSQGRGYSRRVDAVDALARTTGTRYVPETGHLAGMRHDGMHRRIRLVFTP